MIDFLLDALSEVWLILLFFGIFLAYVWRDTRKMKRNVHAVSQYQATDLELLRNMEEFNHKSHKKFKDSDK